MVGHGSQCPCILLVRAPVRSPACIMTGLTVINVRAAICGGRRRRERRRSTSRGGGGNRARSSGDDFGEDVITLRRDRVRVVPLRDDRRPGPDNKNSREVRNRISGPDDTRGGVFSVHGTPPRCIRRD